RADQHHELAVGDRHVDARHGLHAAGELLRHAVEDDLAHGGALYVVDGGDAIVATSGRCTVRVARVLPADVMRVDDTCNVWVVRTGAGAVCFDFGSGAVLDRLDALGVDRITDVLVTHHHRDGVQGLQRAVDHGARVWAPPTERDLLARADEHWARSRPENDYDLRQTRFSPLASVRLAGTVDEYRRRDYGGLEVYALPTPGHTMGSVTYLVRMDGRLVAFSGDLIHSAGKVWSLAATQWTYTGVAGQAATVLSCGVLARRTPDVLLPAHGDPIDRPVEALGETAARVRRLLELRREAS